MTTKTIKYLLLFFFLISVSVFPSLSFSTGNPENMKATVPEEKKKPVSEREAKAYELFNEILELTQNPDIAEALPKIEALYLRIIQEYPETALAQESYWRLVMLYVDKASPTEYEKAELLYHQYLQKYPNPVLKSAIEDSLSQSYIRRKKWDKVLQLYLPEINEFKEKGKLSNPNPLFMYAEAKFNLGDIVEAEKAYTDVIELFPTSYRAATAKKRLEEIKNKKEKPGASTGQ
jgi:TolA-binding protein